MRKIKIGKGFAGTIVEIICTLIFLLFLYSGLSKFIAFDDFIRSMYKQVFPIWMAKILIWVIPFSELIIAAMIMFEKTRIKALYYFIGLMTLFTCYTTAVLFRLFMRVPCPCGGVIKQLDWKQHFFLNLFFILIAIASICLIKRSPSYNDSREMFKSASM